MKYIDEKKFTDENIERQFAEKFDCSEVCSAIKICKDNLDALLYVVWESGLGYSYGGSSFEEEKIREEKMHNAFDEIKTVTGLKSFIKDFEICDYYYLKIFKNHLVSYV